MKNIKSFGQFINEEDKLNEGAGIEQELAEQFKFEINAVKCKVYTDADDAEAFKFDMLMSNGDKIEYDSFFVSSPNPGDAKGDFESLKINGKNFKLASDEERQNYFGVMAAYKRFLKIA